MLFVYMSGMPELSGRLIIVVLVALLAGCAQQQVRYWKAEDIAGMGTTHVRLHHQGETVDTVSAERIRRVIAVKERIAAVAGQRAQLLITDGAEPNASAGVVGGVPTVAINLAMLGLLGDDDDAYATILGHEFAHLALNHSGQRQERESARQGFSHVLGFVLGFAGVPMGGTIANVATTAVSHVYTRDEEREADRIGFDYMRRAGFDPRGAVRVWQRMAERAGSGGLPFLSTHPANEERIETMKKLAGVGDAARSEVPSPTASSTEELPRYDCRAEKDRIQLHCSDIGKQANPAACAWETSRVPEVCRKAITGR